MMELNECIMRKIFQHRYIVFLLAFGALILTMISLVYPKVRDYNSSVENQQRELILEANGKDNVDSYFVACVFPDGSNPLYYAEIALSLGLFLSLLLTKRIFFSFLSTFLFIFEFLLLHELFVSSVRFPYSYFRHSPIFGFLFVAFVLLLAFWQVSVIYRFFEKRSLLKPFIKY